MPQERGYISENQQVHAQTDMPEQRRPQERSSTGLRRVRQIGPLMVVMLAANLGLIGAAKAPESHEPEVQPQTTTDILGGIGFFTNPGAGVASSPDGWNMVIPNPSLPPVYENTISVHDSAVTVQTDGTLPCESNGWITKSVFPTTGTINPNQTYSLRFQAAYQISESPHGINPKVILDWKNSQGQSLNNPDVNIFTSGQADTWNQYNRTYGPGPGQIAIPPQAAKVSVEIKGDQTDPSCSGKLYYDELYINTTTAASTPTPPVSVGGIAEAVDIKTLPANSPGNNNSNEMYVVIGGIVIGTLAAGAAGVKIRSIAKEQRK